MPTTMREHEREAGPDQSAERVGGARRSPTAGGVSPETESSLRIALAEPNALWRDGVSQVLSFRGLSVDIAEGGVASALARVADRRKAIDIVIVGDGASEEAERIGVPEIRDKSGQASIVVLERPGQPRRALKLFQAGVDGYLNNDTPTDAMIGGLHMVHAGERVFPSEAIVELFSAGFDGLEVPEPDGAMASAETARLSTGERRVLSHVAAGRPNKEIAALLESSEATVKVHVRNVLRKVGADNRTQAALWAIRNGMATPE